MALDVSGTPPGETQRIALTRSVAVIKPDSIVIKPNRSGLIGPLIQLVVTLAAAWVIGAFINSLPLWLLMLLLLFVIVSGPTAVLAVVYNILGSAFLMERKKGTCRWQQGFLGLGLGTRELVPFPRIARIEVAGDFEDELNSGDLQDVVRWEIRLVKDNGRVLEIAAITTARPLADEALDRANTLATALGAMSQRPVTTASIPEWALADFDDFDTGEEVEDDAGGLESETMDPDTASR